MQNMGFQENQELGGFESGAVTRFTMLSLNSVPTTTTISSATGPVTSIDHCNTCGSMKRRSPLSSSLQEPTSKKLNLHPSSSAATAIVEGGSHSHSFTKLPLPTTTPVVSTPSDSNSMPVLRRCVSDLINSPGTNNVRAPSAQTSDSFTVSGLFSNPISPDNAKINVSATTPSPGKAVAASVSLPPLPPPLHRSLSDLTPSAYQVTTTSPSAAKTFSRSPSSGVDSIRVESPDSKRLKRMKARVREMTQWWDEVLREDEDDGVPEDNNNNTQKDDSETETEEAVSVERTAECLIIHFKCPCNKGYQILLSGKNCYYKLM
ncbi:hypothetical protein F0562_014821 [Nyssa sinensis]|uniref:Uncharacterized protein n=1 Tax=Nyssa sinensis TaxID=561372 RepID=A0A5J4ZPG9_9ASTE|nr:hypothetical protein F0562_014821 [Nyssa sinensis]